MRRCAEMLLLVAMTTSMLFADGGAFSRPSPQRTIIVGCKPDFPPYSFRGEDGLPCGYNIDIAQAVARVTGLKIQLRQGPWDQIRQALESGDIDAVAGMNSSLQREKQLEFSLPFTVMHHAIFARNDSPKITSEDELKGKKLIVMRGDITHEYVVKHELCAEPILTMSLEESLRLLSEGRGDYALMAELPGLYWIEHLSLKNIGITGPLLAPTQYCFAVKKENVELLRQWNEGLAIITKTGEHRQISDKWFETMVQSCPHKRYYFRQFLMIALPLLALLLLGAIWLWTTRIQVRRATAELRSEISEHRKAEEEIRRLARFPAENPNPVFRVDREGTVLYANQAAKEFLASWQCQPGLHMPEGCCYNRIQHALSTGLPEQGECQAGGRIFAMSIAPIAEEGYANLYGLDVTERSKAAESLQQEIQRHKALMDVSLDGIAIINQEHQVIEANRCFAEMLGYSMEEALTLHTWDWQADVTEEEIRSAYVDLTQSHSRFETHHRRKDGTVFPVEVSLSGTNIGGENLVYTVTRDITKRKQSEKALRESESKYRTLIEQAGDAVFLHDRNGKILDVNRKACENLGYTREELLNTSIHEIDAESAAKGKINADSWNRILAGEQIRFESHQTRKDGSAFPVEVTLGAVTLPVGRGILGIVRDITERKQAEETLRESEDRYHSLVEHAGDAIVLFDHTWRILDVNRKACENLGYTREELLSMVVMTMDPYACRVGLVSEEQWKRISAGEQFHFESYQTRKDGSVFPVEVTLGSVHLAGGNVFLGISRDVTERKQAEEALRKLNEELEQRVAQRTGELANRVNEVEQLNRAMLNLSDDLRKTNQNLEQTAKGLEVANQELEAFSYSVSHDLRSPLRAMDGFSLAVLEDYSSRLDDTGKDYLNRIRTAAQHMGRLIDAILELSRASRVGMETQKVDLSALASQAVEELRHLEPNRHVDVVITPEMSCRGDENLLRQLLANLLGNAWKFTAPREQGWIEFTVLSPEQATAIQKPGRTVYVVRDNGVGFDMHYASKLFTAFQRLHSREEFPGTGVGLATVKRIISRHGGEVWAESVLGQGASIYFTLG